MSLQKRITLAAFILISVKTLGVLREIIFIWYLGINNDTSSIMMMNVIPAAISGFLRYSSINLLIYLKFSKDSNQRDIEIEILKLFFISLLILIVFIVFNKDVGPHHIYAYLIYSIAAILYAAVGYEEYTLLGKNERLKIAFAALVGTMLSIIVVIIGAKFLDSFILPVATLISAIINYLLIPLKSNLFKNLGGLINTGFDKLMQSIMSIIPIIIIEMIGMMFGIMDLAVIKLWGLNPVVFQYNYYASMLYGLPVMILGMAISSQLLDLERAKFIIKIFEKKTYTIVLSLLILSILIYLFILFTSVKIFKLINIVYPEIELENVKEIFNLFSIYSFGMLPAIFVFTITKIFLTIYSAGKIALAYFIALPVKFSVIALGGCLSYDVKEIIPFSTVTGWTALVLTFAVCTRYDKFK
jgi:hypothetical protein